MYRIQAIHICEKQTGKQLNYQIREQNRKGDQSRWVSDVYKFKIRFPN